MRNNLEPHVEWCVIRFVNGRFERARDGYKTADNARRGIPSVAKAYLAEGGDKNATYAVGSYSVGNVVVRGKFAKCA